jgi:hypothetical protein
MKSKIVRFVIREKVYIDQARVYYGYASMISLLMILLKSFGFRFHWIDIAIGLPAFLLFSRMLGWVILKLGLFQAENQRNADLNPKWDDITERLERIERNQQLNINETPTHGLYAPSDIRLGSNQHTA